MAKRRAHTRPTSWSRAPEIKSARPRKRKSATVTTGRLEEAKALHAAGELHRAERIYRAILAVQPDQAETLHLLGTLLIQVKRDPETAEHALSEAARQLPDCASTQMHYGLALRLRDDFKGAERQLLRAIALRPNYADALSNLGAVLIRQGRMDEAADSLRQALSADPSHEAAQRMLDKLHKRVFGSADGELVNLAALDLSTLQFDTLSKAESLARAGDQEAAIELLRGHKKRHALPARSWYLLAECLRQRECREEAFNELLALEAAHPAFERVNIGKAILCVERARYSEAQRYLDNIPADSPVFPETYHVRANCLRYTKDYVGAEHYYTLALDAFPDRGPIYNDYGLMLQRIQRNAEASLQFLEAIRLDPQQSSVHNNLANALKDQGRMADAMEIYRNAIDNFGGAPILRANLVFSQNYVPGLSREEVFDTHRAYGKIIESGATPFTNHPNTREPQRRLRIGYVSGDFKLHSVHAFFEPLFDAHNRAEFCVYLYSNVAQPDVATEAYEAKADGFRNIRGLSDRQAAELIAGDRIDILVDLSGHTGDQRLGVFAWKPAPVQVTWLGYPNTTGMATIDYRFSDEITEPTGDADRYSSETIYRLPGGFHCFRPVSIAPDVAPCPAETNGQITFGSYNYLAKINTEVIDTWASILAHVPNSRLLLKARGLSDLLCREAFIARFRDAGVSPNRVEILNYTRGIAEHLELYGRVDIALDTFPYNGTTTTCEALWMGVPVIALLGETHAARVSASLLDQIGLEPLIAPSKEAYIAHACELADDIPRLAELRRQIRPAMMASPLRDETGFARRIETAYRDIWREHCAKAPSPALTA